MLTREQNIFLAKKLFTELVFNTAYIEGVNVTFPQTQTILDGGVVNDVSVSDIQTVLNLRDAWKYALDTIDAPDELAYICKINSLVSRNESLEWGVLRSGTVHISGTAYIPPAPIEEDVVQQISRINQIADAEERALEYFCYSVRSQLFWDGNKRTSTIISSKMLIEAGAGVLTIDSKNAQEFNTGLLHFYDTNDSAPLKAALKKCVKTMEPPQRRPIKETLKEAQAQADAQNRESSGQSRSESVEPER